MGMCDSAVSAYLKVRRGKREGNRVNRLRGRKREKESSYMCIITLFLSLPPFLPPSPLVRQLSRCYELLYWFESGKNCYITFLVQYYPPQLLCMYSSTCTAYPYRRRWSQNELIMFMALFIVTSLYCRISLLTLYMYILSLFISSPFLPPSSPPPSSLSLSIVG